MEFSKENKLETMADLNRAFAEHLGIVDIPPQEDRADILKRIQQLDEECFSTLAAFNNAWLAFEYIRGDKELMTKVEDVWKMEVDRHRIVLDDSKNDMLEFAKKKDVVLEPLALRLKWI